MVLVVAGVVFLNIYKQNGKLCPEIFLISLGSSTVVKRRYSNF
jgi:hypothetical protein